MKAIVRLLHGEYAIRGERDEVFEECLAEEDQAD